MARVKNNLTLANLFRILEGTVEKENKSDPIGIFGRAIIVGLCWGILIGAIVSSLFRLMYGG